VFQKRKKERAVPEKKHNVYVIELDDAVLTKKKFFEANPRYRGKKGSLYVGMTGRSPAERFEQHKSGYKSGKFVEEFGVRLRPDLYKGKNPLTYDHACKMEQKLARKLRKKGYAVWQN
jgi:predicted GIY-YIG superfamily endonuclease